MARGRSHRGHQPARPRTPRSTTLERARRFPTVSIVVYDEFQQGYEILVEWRKEGNVS